MRYDFSELPSDVQSFVSIPEGTYACRIADVREGLSRDGSARWSLRLEVTDGEYAGRTAAWDSLTWSDRGVYRIRNVLETMGFDVSGVLDIKPDDLQGREVVATVVLEEWEDPRTGVRQQRMSVPYAGYRAEPTPPESAVV